MATIYCTATSLDGYIADDDESLTWLFTTPGGAAPGSTTGADDESAPELHFDRFFAGVGSIVCGANTFEWVRRDLTKDGQPFLSFGVMGGATQRLP